MGHHHAAGVARARACPVAVRPVPPGRPPGGSGSACSLGLAALGVVYLGLAVNWLCAALGLAALLSYVLLYTPLKRSSSLSTLVGAVPGAVPPMMGWAAVSGRLDPGAWALFGILFFWQLPHFFAIAWLLRDEYGEAGFPMVPVVDTDGGRTARQMIFYSLLLLPVSLLPTWLGLAGPVYLVGATALGLVLLALTIDFGRRRTRPAARRVMRFSILYLPAVLAVLLLDRAI